MAKNFNQKQKEIVARKLGYDGPMSGFDEFLRSDPALEAKYGAVLDKYMARGGMAKKYAAGGFTNNMRNFVEIDGTGEDVYDGAVIDTSTATTNKADNVGGTAGEEITVSTGDDVINTRNTSNETVIGATGNDTVTGGTENDTVTGGTANDTVTGGTAAVTPAPAGPPTMPTAPTMTAEQIQVDPTTQNVAAGTGSAGAVTTVDTTAQAAATTAAAGPSVASQTYEAAQAQPAVSAEMAKLKAEQGTVSEQAQVKAVTKEPTSTVLQGVQAEQGVAQQIADQERVVQEGEMISGPAVDQARVEQTLAQAQAAQGEVTAEMTVQGQLGKLLTDFDAGNPPTWAAASLRTATAQLAARGLGASSLAGQAIIQATLEAATPIAAADAETFKQMGLQNLSNKQQMAVLTAQQRAQFLGQEFDQAFQTKVLNAAKISEIANMNFTADVQIAMENARLAQTMDLANLSNRQAVTMAKAAQMANIEMQNLSNQQQAAVVNAQAFLQMDMANLSNRQQTALFKSQQMTQAILSDTASQNAARQFNATSEMQVDQFNSSMVTQVSQFNASQQNAISQFNANQTNAVSQFNAAQENAREEFNAKNALIIAQSNAEWRRQVATADTAAQNVANQFNAQASLQLTTAAYNNTWQTYRDSMQYAFQSGENNLDRENRLALQTLQADAAKYAADREIKASMYKALGNLGASILSGAGGAGVVGKFVDGASNVIVSGINAVSKFLSGASSDVTETFPEDAEFGVRYFSNGISFDTNTNTYYDSTGNVQWQPLEDELIEFDFGDETGGGGG